MGGGNLNYREKAKLTSKCSSKFAEGGVQSEGNWTKGGGGKNLSGGKHVGNAVQSKFHTPGMAGVTKKGGGSEKDFQSRKRGEQSTRNRRSFW